MKDVPGLGAVPQDWSVLRARRVLERQQRPVRTDDEIVTAFRDGQVVRRTARRSEGFTEAVQEIGYHGCREGDLAIHAMDGFAGAMGVVQHDGKMSPVVHLYGARQGQMDLRYVAYVLKQLAQSGFVQSLAKGIRERSTSFDPATLASVELPVPPMDVQRRIADFLDDQVNLLDQAITLRQQQMALEEERFNRVLWDQFGLDDGPLLPLKTLAWYVEGPGIGAADFRDSGIPVIRLSGVKSETVSLDGCNFVDPLTASKWAHLAVRGGELLISGSAGIRFPVVVPEGIAGAIPYTGLIRVGPKDERMSRSLLRYFLGSPAFTSQINRLKTGVGVQHWGPSHLGQIKVPASCLADKDAVLQRITRGEARFRDLARLGQHSTDLLQERKQSLITAAVTGEFDVTTARKVDVA